MVCTTVGVYVRISKGLQNVFFSGQLAGPLEGAFCAACSSWATI